MAEGKFRVSTRAPLVEGWAPDDPPAESHRGTGHQAPASVGRDVCTGKEMVGTKAKRIRNGIRHYRN